MNGEIMDINDILKERLSIKLITHNPDGSETWSDFVLEGATGPVEGEIAIYNSQTGVYERVTTLQSAKNKVTEFTNYLNSLVPLSEPWVAAIEAKLNKRVSSTMKVIIYEAKEE